MEPPRRQKKQKVQPDWRLAAQYKNGFCHSVPFLRNDYNVSVKNNNQRIIN